MYVIKTLRMQGKDINSNAVITILHNYEPDPPEWTRLDMCESCFRELRQFIRNETVRQSTGGKQ